MKFKENVKSKNNVCAFGPFGSIGSMGVECPRCGKWFSYPYSVGPDEPIPMPKVCPFCGEGLLEEN